MDGASPQGMVIGILLLWILPAILIFILSYTIVFTVLWARNYLSPVPKRKIFLYSLIIWVILFCLLLFG
jgi:hypothetical protein